MPADYASFARLRLQEFNITPSSNGRYDITIKLQALTPPPRELNQTPSRRAIRILHLLFVEYACRRDISYMIAACATKRLNP